MLPSLQFPLCLTALSLYAGQGSLHQFHVPHSKISLKPTASSGSLSLSGYSWNFSKCSDGVKFHIFRDQLLLSSSIALWWVRDSQCGERGLSCAQPLWPRENRAPSCWGLMLFTRFVLVWFFFSNLDVTWLLSETVLHIPVLGVVTMNACQEQKVCLNVFFLSPIYCQHFQLLPDLSSKPLGTRKKKIHGLSIFLTLPKSL